MTFRDLPIGSKFRWHLCDQDSTKLSHYSYEHDRNTYMINGQPHEWAAVCRLTIVVVQIKDGAS